MIGTVTKQGQPATIFRVVNVSTQGGLPVATTKLVEDGDWRALVDFAMERAARARQLVRERDRLLLAANELLEAYETGVPRDFDARLEALRHVVREQVS
jgi:hypothetical protein